MWYDDEALKMLEMFQNLRIWLWSLRSVISQWKNTLHREMLPPNSILLMMEVIQLGVTWCQGCLSSGLGWCSMSVKALSARNQLHMLAQKVQIRLNSSQLILVALKIKQRSEFLEICCASYWKQVKTTSVQQFGVHFSC